MRRLFIIIIVVVILAIAVIARVATTKRTVKSEIETQVVVEVVPVQKGNVIKTCELLGTISADKSAQVFPETMGRVTKIFVKEGSYVGKNDALISMRNETIGFEYEEANIRSPISGTVAKIMVEVGSMVMPQSMVALVVDYSVAKVQFNIAEADYQCMSRDRKVFIRVDAAPEDEFRARVTEISPVIDPMTRTGSVKAIINNSKRVLKPGMTARIRINMEEKENVLVVPKESLIGNYLFVLADSTAEKRSVEAGVVGDKHTEILSGVKENEMIVVVGQERLAGGEKVKAVVRGE
jgi:multidrug efflux pump subunit AcrA (membrane-fusion protein)